MVFTKMTKWNKMCRACLTTKESFSYILRENVSADVYFFCTSIQIYQDDLPKALCDTCFRHLTNYTEFKRTCIQSENTLYKLKNHENDKKDATLDSYSGFPESQSYTADSNSYVKSESMSNDFSNHNDGNDKKYTTQTQGFDSCFLETQPCPADTNIVKTERVSVDFDEDENDNDASQDSNSYLLESQLSCTAANLGVKTENVTIEFDRIKNRINTETHPDNLNNAVSDKFVYRNNLKTSKIKNKTGKMKNEGKTVQKKPRLNDTKRELNFKCEICNKKFNYKERFEAHKLEHEGKETLIQCIPCNKTFVTWSGLRRHNENEHTLVLLEKITCNICGKICKSQQTLKVHQQIHGERKTFVCDVCGKRFTSKSTLKTHLETHKDNRERSFTCEHCGKKFYTNTLLLCHVSRRHSGRRFVCHICSYPFTDKFNLVKHLMKHEGKKLFKCQICDKSYTTQSTLVEHKRIHSGERPFSCTYCPKSFPSKRRLGDHVKTHTGERPYKCSDCEQRFAQRSTMKRHMKVHDRVNPVVN